MASTGKLRRSTLKSLCRCPFMVFCSSSQMFANVLVELMKEVGTALKLAGIVNLGISRVRCI